SVLVDLDPPKRSALSQPPAAPVADDAVKLKAQQPSASPTPAADADDFSVF
ncbi:lytic transglycosylase domain-containing protein, partial [Xanthomonas citri pv. citri]|nr:lytic transglycosylase domain-containing protein [Xanthomonas citri pv. citri]